MVLDLLVPALQGAHSAVGRATNRGMDKMREVVVELIKEDEARKAKSASSQDAGAVAVETSDQAADDQAVPAGKRKPKGASSSPDKAIALAQKIRASLELPAHGTVAADHDSHSPQGPTIAVPDDDGGEDIVVSSPTAAKRHLSPAFTAQGIADAPYSEKARITQKRFVLQGKAEPPLPEIGHYRVQENFIRKAIESHEFGDRGKHPSRKQEEFRDSSRELGPEDITKLDTRWASSGSMFVSPATYALTARTQTSTVSGSTSLREFSKQSLMSTGTVRPDLNAIPGSRNCLSSKRVFHEVTLSDDFLEQDKNTSYAIRDPVFDFKSQGKRAELQMVSPYFEAGKYEVKDNVVMRQPRRPRSFGVMMSRSDGNIYAKTKGNLDESQGNVMDRSLYRDARISQPRITHVSEMSKDLPRPPLIKKAPALYDESDPEVVKAVYEREMTLDKNSLDISVLPRRDVAPKMSTSLPRDRANLGARSAQGDILVRQALGLTNDEFSGATKSVEVLKDSCMRRGDIDLLAFDQYKARHPTRLKGAYSSLHRPRSHAAPDFARTAPVEGFSVRIPVKVMQRNRSHDAMPGWSAEAVDGLMSL